MTISVPKILIGEQSATAIAMILHALATNSMKDGALSTALGKLAVSGHDHADEFQIIWKETGGPPAVSATGPPGFGSRLVTTCVKDQLGGAMKVDWPVEGILVVLKLSKARLGA